MENDLEGSHDQENNAEHSSALGPLSFKNSVLF